MKKIIDKVLSKENILMMTIILIIIQPLIDLDYLIYPFLNKLGLPRISTIIRFILIPIMIIIVFYKFEDNKKKSLIILFILSVV